MRRKILFLSSWYPNKVELLNGNFVRRHAEAVATIHDVEVLHCIGNPLQKEKFDFDEQIVNGIRTLIVYYRNTDNPLINFSRRMRGYLLGFKKMAKPDLVHASVLHNSMLFAVYLKKRHQIPFVVTEHWTALQTENAVNTNPKTLKTAKFIGNQAEYILPVSKNLQEGLEHLGIKTPMTTVPNVVDTEVFNYQPHQNSTTKFLHISSLIPRKRVDAIINVAKKLHDDGFNFNLEIGGDGDYEAVQKQINELNTQSYISTFGSLTYEEVSKKMQNSDCFVLFSENETQGCVLLESFSCGVPVISSNVGGVPEIVPENYGILVERNNEEELYNAMKSVIEKTSPIATPTELRKYVENRFSKDAIAAQFSKIYDAVLK